MVDLQSKFQSRFGFLAEDHVPAPIPNVEKKMHVGAPFFETDHTRADEPACAIEHHDRLEAVFVVMGIEEARFAFRRDS